MNNNTLHEIQVCYPNRYNEKGEMLETISAPIENGVFLHNGKPCRVGYNHNDHMFYALTGVTIVDGNRYDENGMLMPDIPFSDILLLRRKLKYGDKRILPIDRITPFDLLVYRLHRLCASNELSLSRYQSNIGYHEMIIHWCIHSGNRAYSSKHLPEDTITCNLTNREGITEKSQGYKSLHSMMVELIDRLTG